MLHGMSEPGLVGAGPALATVIASSCSVQRAGAVPDGWRMPWPKREGLATYTHNRDLRDMLADRGIVHRTIPPRTPQRNGKVERYQQTLAREWAYGQRYRDSHARAAALPIWLTHYNFTRNHSSISNRPPISRVRDQPRHDS